MTQAPGDPLDLGFLEEGRRLRLSRRRRRRWAAVAVSTIITVGWFAYVSASGQWGRVADHWQASVTMIFGGFVAGSTPQGGGAVAFPVFTKGLEIPAEVARSFSLAIQAVGMGTATLAILINRRRVEWRGIAVGLPVAVAAFLAAIAVLGDGSEPFRPSVIPAPYVRVSFTLVLAGMALMTYLGTQVRIRRVSEELPAMTARAFAALVALAALGGLASALTGSGADVLVYVYLAVLLAVDPKVGVPSSVIVMAGVSIVGMAALGIADGQLSVALSADGATVLSVGGEAVALPASRADLFGLWLAAVPMVAWGAPLGTWVAARLPARRLVTLVAALAAVEIVTTAIYVTDLYHDPVLAVYAVLGAVTVGGGLRWLARNRHRFFGAGGVDPDETLLRKDLDVSEDYGQDLEP